MPVQTIALLVVAGGIHSLWNLLSKRAMDAQVFLWLAVVAAAVIFAVPILIWWQPVPLIGLAIALASGLVESVYYLLLGRAYRYGDLSLVYPVARGSAPLFVLLFAIVLLHERITTAGLIGIGLIVVGIYTLHLRSLAPRAMLEPLLAIPARPASRLALFTGVAIAVYSAIDKVGVAYVSPFVYDYLIFVISAAALLPYMLLARGASVWREWRQNWASIGAAGIMLLSGYLLVLFALQGASVSYVASIRSISVVFGALLGTVVLRESFGKMKVIGAALIFAGIVSIGLAG
jgi:drug/metabolite transporter (DMT)-like permease